MRRWSVTAAFSTRLPPWDRPRRVIAKVEHHLGELFPRVGFIVTTLTGTNRAIVRFYNQRGTAEQWIKEGKEATHWTRLSCHRFRAQRGPAAVGRHRVQPRHPAASARPARRHPGLVPDESPASALQ